VTPSQRRPHDPMSRHRNRLLAEAELGRDASLECFSGGQPVDEVPEDGSASLEAGRVDRLLDCGVQLVFDLPEPGKQGSAGSLYFTMLLVAVDVAAIGYWVERPRIIMICVIASGALIGMNITLLTGTVMRVAQVPGPTAHRDDPFRGGNASAVPMDRVQQRS
jgi:hypothetical protein